MPTLSVKKITKHLLKIQDVTESNKSELFVFEQNGRTLLVAGTKHTNNAKAPQVKFLRNSLEKICENTSSKLTICLEGTVPNSDKNLKNEISKYGEQAVLARSARKKGMQVISVEPSFEEVTATALKMYPNTVAHASWALLNVLHGFLKEGVPVTRENRKSIQSMIARIAEVYGLGNDTEAVYEKMRIFLSQKQKIELPKNLEGYCPDKDTCKQVYLAQQATDGRKPSHKVAVAMNRSRDFGLLNNTWKQFSFQEGNVYAWFGANHAKSMAPALEAMGFKKKNPSR